MVADFSWHRPTSASDIMALLQKSNARRTQHPTDVNAESSRSHAVFQVLLTMKRKSGGSSRASQVRHAKLSMVDLAGSERASSTTNSADRFFEGANINKSLLSLGNCINALADGLKHVPFRNSKLTRLLKGSLGGNCKTVMIANVSPSFSVYAKTLTILLNTQLEQRKIKTRARRNQQIIILSATDYARIIEEKNAELTALRAQVTICLNLKTIQKEQQ
jgi:kinesin family protein 18/19